MKNKLQMDTYSILLADDDVDDRAFFSKALAELPIKTKLTIVNDGEQLMNYLHGSENELPLILFLDLSMPRKTGFECLSEIKEDGKLKYLPVIVFTTSFARGIDFERSLINTLSDIGALEYIRKPGNFEELKTIIKNSINNVISNKVIE